MKRFLLAILVLYALGYAVFRSVNAEVWAEDGNAYVIYPENPLAVYYLFRPLSYLDGYVTGMRSHIGPH